MESELKWKVSLCEQKRDACISFLDIEKQFQKDLLFTVVFGIKFTSKFFQIGP